MYRIKGFIFAFFLTLYIKGWGVFPHSFPEKAVTVGKNRILISLEYLITTRNNYYLNLFVPSIKYGITEKGEINVSIPLIFTEDFLYFAFSDIHTGINLNIFDVYLDSFLLKNFFVININLGSGVSKTGGLYRYNGVDHYFFPFSSGFPELSFGFCSSLFFGHLTVNAGLYYVDSMNGEEIFSPKLYNDYIFLNFSAEYFINVSKDLDTKVFVGFEGSVDFGPSCPLANMSVIYIGNGWKYGNFVIKVKYGKNLNPSIQDISRYFDGLVSIVLEYRA